MNAYITVDYTICYPDLNEAELERLLQAVRAGVERALYKAAVQVQKDDGSFLLSLKLDVSGNVGVNHV